MKRTLAFALLFSLFALTSVHAQYERRNSVSLGFNSAYSPTSVDMLGLLEGRKLFLGEVRFKWTFLANKAVAMKYVGGFSPVVIGEGGRSTGPLQEPDIYVYGVGVNPVGLQVNFLNNRRVQPFAIGQVGYLRFSDNMPVYEAQEFNYTFSAGAGVEVFASRKWSWAAGWRYHHYSNWANAWENPGVDNHLINFEFTYHFRNR